MVANKGGFLIIGEIENNRRSGDSGVRGHATRTRGNSQTRLFAVDNGGMDKKCEDCE